MDAIKNLALTRYKNQILINHGFEDEIRRLFENLNQKQSDSDLNPIQV